MDLLKKSLKTRQGKSDLDFSFFTNPQILHESGSVFRHTEAGLSGIL